MVWLAVSVVGHDPVKDGADLCGTQGSVEDCEAVYGSADEQVGQVFWGGHHVQEACFPRSGEGVGEQPPWRVDDAFPVAGAQLLVGLPVDVQRGGQPRVRPGADRLGQHRADPAEVRHRVVGGGETPVPDVLRHGVDDQVGQRRPAPVDRRLGHPGQAGDVVNAQTRIALLREQGQDGLHDASLGVRVTGASPRGSRRTGPADVRRPAAASGLRIVVTHSTASFIASLGRYLGIACLAIPAGGFSRWHRFPPAGNVTLLIVA